MKKLIQSFVLVLSVFASTTLAQAEDPKTFYNIPDDGYAIVPIPFGFPFYGRTFTHSIMFDNGVVSFYDPLTEAARLGGQQFNASPLSNSIGSNFHYSIMPLWTDLVGNSNSKFYTQTDSSTYLRYNWQDVQQWGHPTRLNSFNVEIKPSGFFGINYEKVNISGYPVTIGHLGNASLAERAQIYHQPSGGTTLLSNVQNWNISSTSSNLDCSNPLNDPLCPGYAQAQFTLQCTINPLHNIACPGYSAAYYTQQCTINALYDTGCPGYAQAYLSYQCSLDALYSTSCSGYEQAYFNQQCSLNPLYNNQCPGYADAFYVQQCNISPLYDSGCNGYAQAYFDQQCSLNGLYDRTCPNYAEAYAKQQLLNPVVVSQPIVIARVEESKPALVSDPVVNDVITTTAPSASPAQAATATVPLAPAPAPVATVAAAATEEKKNDTSKDTSSSSTSNSSSSSSEKKDAPKTTRQALAERRLEAARAKAAEEGKNLAKAANSSLRVISATNCWPSNVA
jgi:hypothetical protein